MTARLIDDGPLLPAPVMQPAPTEPTVGRVLSVAPSADGAVPGGTEVFLTPRVLDQRAFEELSGTLKSLIDESAVSSKRLEEILDRVQQADSGSKDAAAQLQERLKLGARMLKAFQTQLERVNGVVGNLDQYETKLTETDAAMAARHAELESVEARIEACWTKADAQLAETMQIVETKINATAQTADGAMAETLDVLEARLGSVAETAEQTVNDRVRDLDQRADEVVESARARMDVAARSTIHKLGQQIDGQLKTTEELDDRIATVQETAKTVQEMVESVEVNAAALSHRSARAAGESQETIRELEEAVRTAEARHRQITDDLQAAAAQQELIGRSAARVEQIHGQLAEVHQLQDALGQRMAEINQAGARIDEIVAASTRLERVLDRLEPWKHLLETTADSGTTGDPVDRLVQGLRTSIGDDMNRLSTMMRGVADRVEQLGTTPPPMPASAPAAMPTVITEVEAARPTMMSD